MIFAEPVAEDPAETVNALPAVVLVVAFVAVAFVAALVAALVLLLPSLGVASAFRFEKIPELRQVRLLQLRLLLHHRLALRGGVTCPPCTYGRSCPHPIIKNKE